jgi:hypothetical protein
MSQPIFGEVLAVAKDVINAGTDNELDVVRVTIRCLPGKRTQEVLITGWNAARLKGDIAVVLKEGRLRSRGSGPKAGRSPSKGKDSSQIGLS